MPVVMLFELNNVTGQALHGNYKFSSPATLLVL